MTWLDVDEILYDGDEDSIKKIKCPDCGGKIRYSYYEGTFKRECLSCMILIKDDKAPAPNCVKYFGKQATIQ